MHWVSKKKKVRNGSPQSGKKYLSENGQDKSLEINFEFLNLLQDGVIRIANYKKRIFIFQKYT